MATNKITKAQRNTDIISILRGETPAYGTSVADAITHLEHENELLARKNSSTTPSAAKATAQVEAEKMAIVAYLNEQTEGKTATDVAQAVGNGMTNQKAANRLKKLVEQGTVTRETIKGKAYFSIAQHMEFDTKAEEGE